MDTLSDRSNLVLALSVSFVRLTENGVVTYEGRLGGTSDPVARMTLSVATRIGRSSSLCKRRGKPAIKDRLAC